VRILPLFIITNFATGA